MATESDARDGPVAAQAAESPDDPLNDPLNDSWNDAARADSLWVRTNYGEAVSGVLTPASWSLFRRFMRAMLPFEPPPGHALESRVAGRLYFHMGAFTSLVAALGFRPRRLLTRGRDLFGPLPPDLPLPPPAIGRVAAWRWLLVSGLPGALRVQGRIRRRRAEAPDLVARTPAYVAALPARLAALDDGAALAALGREEVLPAFDRGAECLHAVTARLRRASRGLDAELLETLGPEDAAALSGGGGAATGAGGPDDLASLGPALGLARLASGEIERGAYLEAFGHRGPNELELADPRPAEDPAWLDGLLSGLGAAPPDVDARLAMQAARVEAARARLRGLGRRGERLLRRVDETADAAREREAVRSELTRLAGALRAWVLRAGDLLGLEGDAAFYLGLDELAAAVEGEPLPDLAARLDRRRATRARYARLPEPPRVIRGPFDPFAWAADPRRATDVYLPPAVSGMRSPAREGAGVFSAEEVAAMAGNANEGASPLVLRGMPGAAGVVEGRVRLARGPEEAGALRPGEILVAPLTNVGWTPFFPRAAAVVTDVGATLSHAAIVARELGLPAVVGCGDATERLATGDLVRVDGAAGTVTRLTTGAPPREAQLGGT